jgi:hypothetical protein
MQRRPPVATQRLADLRDRFCGGERLSRRIKAAIRRAKARRAA